MTSTPPEAHEPQGTPGEQAPADAAPAAPQYSPPEQPQYAPPQQPQYPTPEQPQYQAPPAGAYQQPPGYAPPPGYQQQPQPGYGQPAATDPASTITLNYWLSVFFAWIPALIFYMMERDKGNPQARYFHAANLNFALIRTAAAIVLSILLGILLVALPWGMWWLAYLIMWAGNIALAVLHGIAALSAGENYKKGGRPAFPFNFDLVK